MGTNVGGTPTTTRGTRAPPINVVTGVTANRNPANGTLVRSQIRVTTKFYFRDHAVKVNN